MRIPLGIKISISSVIAVLIIVFFLLFNAYSYLVNDVIEEMKEDIHISMSRLQQTVEFLIQKNELEQVQVELSSIGSIKHMEHAFLVNENNEIVASSQLSYIGTNVKSAFDEYSEEGAIVKFNSFSSKRKAGLWMSDNQADLFAIYPVFLGLKNSDRLIESETGFIVAHIDLQWISSNAFKVLQLKALPMVVALALMLIVFSVFHDYLLVRRIKNINRAALQFASSGYQSRANVKGNDEISDLANAFNKMAETVETQQDKLIKNEKNISLIMNSMEDGVITINEKGLVRSFNKSAERMFGYSNDEIINKNVNILMPDPYHSKHDGILKEYIETGVKHIIGIGRDVPALHKDGHIFTIHLSVNELPKNADGERLFIASCLDVTVLKEQEQQLRHSQKMDALGKLTGGIAHDYNNMLGVILGYSELLIEKLSYDPKLKKYITEIHHAGKRGANLTKKLLSFSRQKTASPDVTNINSLLENNKNMLEKTLTARIQLVYEPSANLWPVYLDKGDLEDSVLNMCINAMHAIEQNGRLIISTKNVQLSRLDVNELKSEIDPGDCVCLSVCDNGSGIDEDTIDRIFDPFFSTKGEKGNGLGLSQVYGFVSRSKGAIKVESNASLGTCFKLYFPRYVGEKVSIENEVPVSKNHKGNETILVVDDEPSLRSLLNEMLTSCGYTVLLAESGMQAIELLHKHHVDMVLSDVIMPGMNGFKLAKHIYEHFPAVKVQLASGYSDNGHDNEQNELHDNLIRKPYDWNLLLGRLREVLDGSSESHTNDNTQILIGIQIIDDEHKEIINKVDQCAILIESGDDAVRLDRLMNELLAFTEAHFSREESWLEKCGHPNIKQYSRTHEFLIKALRKNYAQYKNKAISAYELLGFINEWVQDHINSLDKNMLIPLVESNRDDIENALSEI